PVGLRLVFPAVALAALIPCCLCNLVPGAIDQMQNALGTDTKAQIHREAKTSTGMKHEVLTAIDKRVREVPKAGALLHPAVEVTVKVFEAILGLFFVLSTAAYWIFERERAVAFVTSLLPRPRRKQV